MPELLDVFVYNEVQSGATAAQVASLLDIAQQEVWERMEAARFSAELRQFRESVCQRTQFASYRNGMDLRQT